MRVLVVGTLPPPGGASARELAAVAARRQADGDEVELLSPDPSSAVHRSRRLDGLFLAWQLAWLSRRFDAVVLRVEDDLPCRRDMGRATRAAVLGALGLAVSRYGEVTLRVDSPVPLPGGVGGRATRQLWAAADEIVVRSAADRDELLRAPGIDPQRIVIDAPRSALCGADTPWPDATEPGLRSAVLEVVRARAAREALTHPDDVGRRRPTANRLLGVGTVLLRYGARRAVRATRRAATTLAAPSTPRREVLG